MRLICRVCDSPMTLLANYENMPSRAQHLPTLPTDKGITLTVMQCDACALVQLANDPVPYWQEPIRADVSEEMREFRKGQLAKIPGGFLLLDLEHAPIPAQVLESKRNSVKDGAVGIIEVPNFDMILKFGLVSEFMVDHLCYFTEATLRRTLEMNGFDVLSIDAVWHDYILSAMVRKRGHIDLSGMKFDGSAILKFIDGRSAAIWGAGHQALATMSLLNLDERKIKYVVDSAPTKQGRYTPVTHIPIVPPEALATDPVDALVIMCGSYSKEVAALAKVYNIESVMVV